MFSLSTEHSVQENDFDFLIDYPVLNRLFFRILA